MTPAAPSTGRFEIYRDYKVDAARRLLGLPEGHKCARVHGHTFRIRIWVTGPLNQQGWVVDFADIDRVMAPILDAIDHRHLNEVPGLEQPTTENIALWIARQAANSPISILRIEVHESADAGVVYHCT